MHILMVKYTHTIHLYYYYLFYLTELVGFGRFLSYVCYVVDRLYKIWIFKGKSIHLRPSLFPCLL